MGNPARVHSIRIVGDSLAALSLFAGLGRHGREVAAFAYLDADRTLLGLRHIPSRDADAIELPIRRITADALAFDAVALVMAHNHPSGDPTPSRGDLAVTRRMAVALRLVGVTLIDHLVIGRDDASSLKGLGLL